MITTELVGCSDAGMAVGDVAVTAFGISAEVDAAAALEVATLDVSGVVPIGVVGPVFELLASGKGD